MLNARQNSLKILANSFYGYLGFSMARWYCLQCSRSITAYGRNYIQQTIKKVNDSGFTTIYSDTDSVFFTLNKKTKQDSFKILESVNSELPGLMELEFEGSYSKGIFVSTKDSSIGAKKKYALMSERGIMKVRGFETVRRNWSPIAKEAQNHVLKILLSDGDSEKAISCNNAANSTVNRSPPSFSAMCVAVFHTRYICHQSCPEPSPNSISLTYFSVSLMINFLSILNLFLTKITSQLTLSLVLN